MKNRSAIILLFVANTISGIAQGISMLAIPWYFAQNEEMSKFGLVYAITTVFSMFWVPYSGTFVDRYNRRNLFLAITAVCGAIIFGVTGLGYYWGALPWYLVASVFMVTFLNYNIHYPTLYAFIQEISEPQHYAKMTSYLEIQGQMARMMAGAFGALLLEGTKNGVLQLFGFDIQLGFDIEAWKIHEIFFLDASTYLVAFCILLLIRFQSLTQRYFEKGGVWTQLKIGYQYLKTHPLIFIFGLASYAIFLTVLLEGFYLGAQYAKAHLQADGSVYATAAMCYSIGAVLSGAMIQRVFKRFSVPTSIIIMTWVTAALYFILAGSKMIPIYYLMIFILGLTNAGTRVMRTTFLFRNIDNQVYGRANSIFFLANILFRIFFIAIFALPFFQRDNHVIYTFVILGLFLVGSVLILMKYAPQIVKNKV